jgi:hypothetical protein
MPWPPNSRRGEESGLRAVGNDTGEPVDWSDTEGAATPVEPMDRLPATFWNSTPTLSQIRQMAQARRTAPDAVAARRPRPGRRHGRSHGPCRQRHPAARHARLVLRTLRTVRQWQGATPRTPPRNSPRSRVDLAYIDISTGQGLIAAYLDLDIDPDDDGKKKILVQRRTRGYALATEGSVLDAMAQMSAAATLNGVLCKAWMSERQGTSATPRSSAGGPCPRAAYTLSMSLGVQEEPAAKLLEMGSIGLPQRLAWAHATLGPRYSRSSARRPPDQ